MKHAFLLVIVGLAGCGGYEAPRPTVLDLRAKLPPADPKYADLLGGSMELAPGKEMMFCTDLVYDGPETAFDLLETTQGKFGHHAVLLIPKRPNPPGTVTDCTSASEMKNFSLFALADTNLPVGHGGLLPKGKQLVLQSHYVNTGKAPIRVQDVVRIRKLAIAEVTSWDSVFINTTDQISIPPHAMGMSTSFDCPIAKDVRLMLLGGHMHEWGAKFDVKYVAVGGAEQPLYKIDSWKAEYRDTPPVELHLNDPVLLKAGGALRITCTWNNTSDAALSFPSEMCVLFGYAAGSKEPIVCGGATL